MVILRFARRNDALQKGVLSTADAVGLPKGLLRLSAPYWAPVSLILLTRLIPPIKEVLTSFTWEWVLLDTFGGNMEPFYHPGTMLFLGLLAGAGLQGAKRSEMKPAMAETFSKLLPVVIALIAMLSLSQIMVHAGMIAGFSAWAAQTAGRAVALALPSGRRPWHIRDRIGHSLQYSFQRLSADRGKESGPAGSLYGRGAGIWGSGRQHRLPAQYHCRWCNRWIGRAGRKYTQENRGGLSDLFHAGGLGGIVAGSFSVITDFSRKRFMDENHCL